MIPPTYGSIIVNTDCLPVGARRDEWCARNRKHTHTRVAANHERDVDAFVLAARSHGCRNGDRRSQSDRLRPGRVHKSGRVRLHVVVSCGGWTQLPCLWSCDRAIYGGCEVGEFAFCKQPKMATSKVQFTAGCNMNRRRLHFKDVFTTQKYLSKSYRKAIEKLSRSFLLARCFVPTKSSWKNFLPLVCTNKKLLESF